MRAAAIGGEAAGGKGQVGAGEGNRTLVISLEGCCSTIELHPRGSFLPSMTSSEFVLHKVTCHCAKGGLPTEAARPVAPALLRPDGLRRAQPPPLRGVGWWRGLDSNQRRLSQRIYSPSPLATRAPLRFWV